MQRFEVNKAAFGEHRVSTIDEPELKDGEIRVAVDFFAFTANNMTYAAAGDALVTGSSSR